MSYSAVPPLSRGEFAEFFEETNGYKPFPWQVRLLDEILEARSWPELLDIPTASGKTATIDVAIFLMALSADDETLREQAPRRVFFVVDRRTIVDEAYVRAERLGRVLSQLLEAGNSSAASRVAKRLDLLAGDIPGRRRQPLIASVMRGGIHFEAIWALSPRQPAICVSTVDQLGSRLLFRGYGVSEFAAPIHAGLIAYNSLIVLDEAHLSGPFEKTLGIIQHYCGTSWAKKRIGVSTLTAVRMSATSYAGLGNKRYCLGDEDYADPVLHRRLATHKRVRLVDVQRKPEDCSEIFAEEAIALAECVPEARTPVTAIIVNRVRTARLIHEAIRRTLGKDADVILLTGRSRPVERDELLDEYRERIMADPSRDMGGRSRPIYVVATQCIEAGADFDFTGMVTELAPLSSLTQRAGRLDRMGTLGESELVVVLPPDELLEETDSVYSMPLITVSDFLRKEVGKQGGLDFGPTHFPRVSPDELGKLNSPEGLRPTLRPADVDLLCQTSPRPFPDPDIAPFLHGALDPDRDVSLVWRLDVPEVVPLTVEEIDPGLADVLSLIPPTSREALQIPFWAVKAWLAGRKKTALDVPDVEGASVGVDGLKTETHVLRWRSQVGPEPVAVSSIRPGDVILLSTGVGGCDHFGWNPASTKPVEDLSQKLVSERRRPFVRIRAEASDLIDDRPLHAVRDSLSEAERELDLDPDATIADFTPAVSSLRQSAPEIFDAEHLGQEPILIPYAPECPRHGFALIRRTLLPGKRIEPFFSDDDEDTSIATTEITLEAHSEGVRNIAAVFAEGLAPDVASDLIFAAYQHDVGKAEPRFQAFLNRGRVRPSDAPQLAKGFYELRSPERARQSRELSGLKTGLRHEAWSVAALDEFCRARNRALPVHDQELCRWLVGSHHGRGRPWFNFVSDPNRMDFEANLMGEEYAVTVTGDQKLSHLDGEWVGTFWSVIRRYGWWGAAYLEAVLRLADHRRSEAEMLTQRQYQRHKDG